MGSYQNSLYYNGKLDKGLCCLPYILLLILMDSLLAKPAQANWEISIKGIYTGSFGHADDVRSVTADLMSMHKEANL